LRLVSTPLLTYEYRLAGLMPRRRAASAAEIQSVGMDTSRSLSPSLTPARNLDIDLDQC
jgi:hypothetical protein